MQTHDMLVAALCLLVVFALGSGCGNQALQAHQEVALVMLNLQAEGGPAIRELRVNAGITAGREAQLNGSLEEEAQQLALDAANEWNCAIEGHRIYATAVSAYIEVLTLWQAGQDFGLTDVLPFVSRAIDAYGFVSSCLRGLGSDLFPETPSFLNLIPSEWSLGDE